MLTKKLTVGEILKKENIKIVENSHYVLTYGEIDSDSVDLDFDYGSYKVKKLQSKLSNIEIDFSVYKDNKPVLDCVSDSKVRKYIEKIVKPYKGYRYWGAEMLEKYKENIIKGIEFEKNNKFFQEYDEDCIIGLLTDIIRQGISSSEVILAKRKLRPCLALLNIVDKDLNYKFLVEKTDNTIEKIDLVDFSINTLSLIREKSYKVAFVDILQTLYSLGLDDNNFLFSNFKDNVLEDYISVCVYDPCPYIEASLDLLVSELFYSEYREEFNEASLDVKLTFLCAIFSVSYGYKITDIFTDNFTEINEQIIKDYYPLLTKPLNLIIKENLKKDSKGHYTLLNLFGRDINVSKYLYAYYYRNVWSVYDYPPTFKEFVKNNLSSKEFVESLIGKII